jgi:hypothetical protein
MIEVAVELIEPVHGRQEFVAVAEMVLPNLGGCIAERLQRFGDGDVASLNALLRTGHADGQHPRAEWMLSHDEGRTTSRA